MAQKYVVRLRKTYRNEFTGEVTGVLPVKSFETTAPSEKQAENNARHRFGADGQVRQWRSVGWGEQMRVECIECRLVA